jgi:signal transduction histidine kinase
MVEHLTRDLGSLRHGDHLCLPYDHVDEKTEAVVPFIAEGLARGERCMYIAELDQREALLGALSNAGVNASRALDRGSLWLRTPQETYLRSGKFDPNDMLAFADELIARALGDGFVGVRGSGEVSGAEDHGIDWADLYSYELRFNERFAGRPIVALCRYHRAVAPAARIADALRTHPTAIVSGRVCRNSYYEKPDVALAGDAERVEWMLHQLRRSSASGLRALAMTRTLAGETSRLAAENQSRAHAEEELERAIRMRDRFLDDLTRELAAPVAGLSAEIEALGGIAPAYERRGRDERTASSALVRHLKRLGSVVEQLKEVSRLTNRQTVVPLESIDLCDVARTVALRNRERLTAMGSGVVLHCEPRIQGRWDRRRLEQLLTNLLLSAARLGAGQPVDLELGTDGGSALISVRYQGAPRAWQDEAGVFDGVHDSAGPPPAGEGRVGLWVAREIASAFGGSLTLPGTAPANGDDDGAARTSAVISVELPRSGTRSRYGVPAPGPSRA